ncbi:hypothetical protein [Nocardia flavorosea]|uniref:Uncharacterized protein n=1 Tax=Nocardia flavorosea TaxID=53429 RepID=A0A846YMR9_9NOCA|nr:hypothetical protein [Nocardia flavorosea]NKY60407.1 hypothetical protein [Nocardia flavorosea]
MTYNIPRIRGVHRHVTRNPETLDQGSWMTCLAGHTVRLYGEHGLLKHPDPRASGVQAVHFRTGELRGTEDLAGELLGLHREEAAGLFACNNQDAIAWLEDILAAHDTAVWDRYVAELSGNDTGRVIR